MDHAYRAPWALLLVLLFGLATLSGCANSAANGSPSSITPAKTSTGVLAKADQQISQQKISAAQKTLAQTAKPNNDTKNLVTGLKYYRQAERALNRNELSVAKTYFQTLRNYQGTTDAAFINARRKLDQQYQAVKVANGYYNSARDALSVHDLNAAKTAIDKLDGLAASHPVIKQLQKKSATMKQAIMNYEASQSTSSSETGSTVDSPASSSSTSTSSASQSSTSSSASSSASSSSSSSTATSSANSSVESESAPTTASIIRDFQAASGEQFASDTLFDLTSQTEDYYQISATATDQTATQYRYYPNSGKVTKQNSKTGAFE